MSCQVLDEQLLDAWHVIAAQIAAFFRLRIELTKRTTLEWTRRRYPRKLHAGQGSGTSFRSANSPPTLKKRLVGGRREAAGSVYRRQVTMINTRRAECDHGHGP